MEEKLSEAKQEAIVLARCGRSSAEIKVMANEIIDLSEKIGAISASKQETDKQSAGLRVLIEQSEVQKQALEKLNQKLQAEKSELEKDMAKMNSVLDAKEAKIKELSDTIETMKEYAKAH